MEGPVVATNRILSPECRDGNRLIDTGKAFLQDLDRVWVSVRYRLRSLQNSANGLFKPLPTYMFETVLLCSFRIGANLGGPGIANYLMPHRWNMAFPLESRIGDEMGRS